MMEWLVAALGVAAIAWVNWYFFVAGRAAAPAGSAYVQNAAAPGAVPEIVITVRGGYEPSAVRVKAGAPVRLVFDRQDTSSCSEEVVFPDFSIRKYLPTGKRTAIEITPPSPGSYDFMCGMGMLRGVLIAEA